MKPYAKHFYTSKAWQDCRASYIKSVGGLCERCLAKGIYTAGEIVHHKVYITPENVNDESVTLNWDNLELVCRQCHADEHEKPRRNRRFVVDEFGKVVAR